MSVDLRTSFLGLELAHPIVPSASPATGKLDNLKRLETAGASAVVLPSLFEEQIVHEESEIQRLAEFAAESFAEATFGYFPEMTDYNTGPGPYLKLVQDAKATLEIPVIASLNGSSAGGWIAYARKIQDAGADALELNIYFVPGDPTEPGTAVEQRYLDLVQQCRESVTIPIAVKMGPYFSSVANMVSRIVDAGANGLVLFNRYMMPDVDLEALTVTPALKLSDPSELRLPLRWIALLRGKVDASLALSSGVHSAQDALKALLAGADVIMMTSALLHHGPEYLTTVLDGLRSWLDEHEYASVEQAKGSLSEETAPNPEAFSRSNYMETLISYTGPAV
ncbi:dihydroorotate dehydrogenase B (NAD(+)), catalytic subunit [bacterium BMS3Abin02]|nr:dihydroorotate dehydrogenase B (NAD(+)), catalytic subunit [bacterium BMS3Abin02]GBE22634.1 dihydroorotate dehydrogenase B (NAD(+)), catalytic subunit [bacterium BMS3Bbin01]